VVRPLLFERFPDLGRAVPWMPIATVPTAVEPCDALTGWLGRGGVFMKRDDLASPLYGGNKVRRFEYLFADARAKGKTRIVTVGGLGSTQALATALHGRALGFDVSAVLFDQPVTDFVSGAIRSFVASGASVRYGGGYLRTALRTAKMLLEQPDAYFIWPGAANALANLAYVDAMLELGEQVARGEAPKPDVIVLPTGSAGTLAALALGAAHLGWSTEVVGVRITSALACNRVTVSRIVGSTDRFLAARDARWTRRSRDVRFTIEGRMLGAGYGEPTRAAIEGAERWADLTGAPGEVTYTGKTLAALRLLVRERKDAEILLWNTLSTPRPPLAPESEVPEEFQFVVGKGTT
jgi:1-aminocyclopropane-1-carboxylate deaminase/D-cysteine desulfhydrase-like pyridoxal-dependent ACC family enzyme